MRILLSFLDARILTIMVRLLGLLRFKSLDDPRHQVQRNFVCSVNSATSVCFRSEYRVTASTQIMSLKQHVLTTKKGFASLDMIYNKQT